MKALKIAGIVIVVLIILMIAIPLLFTNQIAGIVKKEANKSLNATLNFGSVGLNLFENFPNLTLNIDDLSIINKAPFEGDTLLRMAQFEASVSLWKAIAGEIHINKISLDQPDIFIYVMPDSTANYNIIKDSVTVEEDTIEAGSTNIALEVYSVSHANIAYIDKTSDMSIFIKDLNHSGSGDLSSEKFLLDTETDIASMTVEMSGIKYFNNVKTFLDMELDADMAQKKFTLKDNVLKLNNLQMKMNGFVAMPDTENISMDLTFASERTDFKDIISLIPAVYSGNFDELKSSGKMELNGFAKGLYSKDRLPSFNLSLKVINGSFQYPKLPTPVNNVNVDLAVSNPGGSKDQTLVDLKSLHLELGNEPFDARLLMKNPQSGPWIDTKVKGRIDLGKLKNALTLENVNELSGLINADFQATGSIAGLKNKNIDNLKAGGQLNVSNIKYGTEDLPHTVNIRQAQLIFNPQNAELKNFSMQMGQNDLSASGSLSNIFSYILSDGTLGGKLSVNSSYFNLNPYLTADEKKVQENTPPEKLEAVELPDNISFTMNASFKKLIYDNLTLENVKGSIILADSRLNLDGLTMNLLGGTLVADGSYYAPEGTAPAAAFNLQISDFNIGKTYESFVTVKQFAPMAKFIQGSFSASMNMSTALGEDMMPDWNSFDAVGKLNLERAEVKNFKPFEKVGDALNISALKNPVLTNVNPSFKIDNGRFSFSPVEYKIQNYTVSLTGSNGIDQSIDYVMGVDIPAAQLKNQANKAINSLLKKDVDLITANSVKVNALIKGKIDDPVVSTTAGSVAEETVTDIKTQAEERLTQEVEKKKEEIKQEAAKKVDTLKSKAQDKIKQEAEKALEGLFKKKK